MEGIYHVGTTVCSNAPNSIFAYQVGDGFIISSEFGLNAPSLPLGICIFLLRLVATRGGFAKCAASTGEMADIKGCFPRVIQDNLIESHAVRLGSGLMTLFPVMGTALINTYTLSKKERGSVLIWDKKIDISSDQGIVVTKDDGDYLLIDWLHSRSPYADRFLEMVEITDFLSNFETIIRNRIKATPAEPEWIASTLNYNGLNA